MSEKMSQSASNFWQKTKDTTNRLKQKAMVKMGKSEETKDIAYSQEKERFLEHYKAMNKFNKDLGNFMECLQKLAIAQAALAQDFYEMYESKAPSYNVALKNQDICKLNENARLSFEEGFRECVVQPLSRYLGQFAELKERIEERSRRRVDMDRYAHDVKSHQEKFNQAKLQPAELKYEAARQNYTSLNEELLKDLPALYEDRLTFFDPLIAAYSNGIAEYYRQCAKNTSEVLGLVAHIDRKGATQYPRVTTDTEVSSANPKNKKVPSLSGGLTTFKESQAGKGDASTTPAGPDSDDEGQSVPAAAAAVVAPGGSPGARKSVAPVPPSRPAAAKPVVKAKGLFDFNTTDPTELPFKFDDVLVIHSQTGEWWEAEKDGRKGLIPANYVQLI